MSVARENAKAEKERLEADMLAIKQRLSEIDQFLRLYAKFESADSGDTNKVMPQPLVAIAPKRTILSVALEILSDDIPRSTKELLEKLAANGMQVGGEDKIMNLSSILSRAKDSVQFDRGIGWTLKKERPGSAVTESGLDELL